MRKKDALWYERKRSAIKGEFVLLFMQKINTFVE